MSDPLPVARLGPSCEGGTKMAASPGRSSKAVGHTASLALGSTPRGLLCSHKMLNRLISDKKTSSIARVLVDSYAYILKTSTRV